MSDPINISPEAREAAVKELCVNCHERGTDIHTHGHFVQLAINSAVAEKDKEIERLRDANKSRGIELKNRQVRIDRLQAERDTLTKQLAELREIAEGLAKYVGEVKKAYEFERVLRDDPAVNHTEIFEAEQVLDSYTQWKEKNQ